MCQLPEKKLVNNLRTDQVEVVIEVLSKAQMAEWFVWREGLPSWAPLTEFSLLAQAALTSASVASTPPIPVQAPKKPLTPPARVYEESLPNLSLINEGMNEDRDHSRFIKVADIRIVSNDRIYSNKTVDISLKGMQVKEPLPSGLPHFFSVELKLNGRAITVICSEVKNADGSPSTRLKIEKNEHVQLLRTSLLAG